MFVIPMHGILHLVRFDQLKIAKKSNSGIIDTNTLGIQNVRFFPFFPFKFQYNQQYIEKKFVFICNVFGKSIWFISTKHRHLHFPSKCVILVLDVNLFIFLQYDTQRLCQTYTMNESIKSVWQCEGMGGASVFATIKKYVEFAAFYSTGMMWETSTRQINTWNMFQFMRHQRIPTLCLHQTICNNKIKHNSNGIERKSQAAAFFNSIFYKKNYFFYWFHSIFVSKIYDCSSLFTI